MNIILKNVNKSTIFSTAIALFSQYGYLSALNAIPLSVHLRTLFAEFTKLYLSELSIILISSSL